MALDKLAGLVIVGGMELNLAGSKWVSVTLQDAAEVKTRTLSQMVDERG